MQNQDATSCSTCGSIMVRSGSDVRFAKSIVDYIFRWMTAKFLSPEAQFRAGVNNREELVTPPEQLPLDVAAATSARTAARHQAARRSRFAVWGYRFEGRVRGPALHFVRCCLRDSLAVVRRLRARGSKIRSCKSECALRQFASVCADSPPAKLLRPLGLEWRSPRAQTLRLPPTQTLVG